jgi:hypothetical protein
MSANPIIEVWGNAGGEWRTAFGTPETATVARVGDFIQVTGVPPYDGAFRLTKVWRAAAASPPKMVYAIGEDLFTHFGPPQGWPAGNHPPAHNDSALLVLGGSANHAVSGPQKLHVPAGALVRWEAFTAGRHPQTFTLADASGQVVATATGESPDGALVSLGTGQLRARGEPYYRLSFDVAARILPSTTAVLLDHKLYAQRHKLMTDRTAQDGGYRDLMVDLEVFENLG